MATPGDSSSAGNAPASNPAGSTGTAGLLNLEKELVCFICTEVLYQPLTLIDCLHTFCGSCLKEWFSHQHRKASHSHSSSSANPYTCPTCRAPVKDAQHNAMINTLLDMFLSANPSKDRTADEKAEMAGVYKPGDDILPKVEKSRRRERERRGRREEEDAAEQERRAIEQARELSMQDLNLGAFQTAERLAPRAGSDAGSSRSRERRIRDTSGGRRATEPGDVRTQQQGASSTRPRSERSVGSGELSPPATSPRHPDAVEARQRGARTVAHQASLRSLVSASDGGTGTGDSLSEAQLMQEILAEGLLDGINVDELTEQEQDELSEIIAERYRQLYPERVRRAVRTSERHSSLPVTAEPVEEPDLSSSQIEEADRNPRPSARAGQRRGTQPSPRSSNSVTIGGSESRQSAPTAFPPQNEHNLSPPLNRAHRRRESDEGSGREGSRSRSSRGSQAANRSTRAATDLSDRPQSSSAVSNRPRQLSNTNRSNTEPQRSPRASEVWAAGGNQGQTSGRPEMDSPASRSPRTEPTRPPPPVPTARAESTASAPEATSSTTVTQFEEPSIQCARCSRRNIQYEIYKHCGLCSIDLCLRCYRNSRPGAGGCNHWFGFGHAAMFNFERSQPQSRVSRGMELPHLLTTRQYLKPTTSLTPETRDDATMVYLTTSDPVSRLQEGNFCDRCGAFANSCFWSCDYCNDGEWGFCNDCVNTAHCCTHPLLPVAHKAMDNKSTPRHEPGASTLSPRGRGRDTSPAHSAASSTTSASPSIRLDYVPLNITTSCDICSRPIPQPEARYHCPSHPTPSPENTDAKGDFDMCAPCYTRLVKVGRIKREDGPDGWRLCPEGHRMMSIAFEPDTEGAHRRVVMADLVGGVKLSDADVTAWRAANIVRNNAVSNASPLVPTRGVWEWKEDAAGRRGQRQRTATLPSGAGVAFPPDGGTGASLRAVWPSYPEEGDDGKGELMFPKHAEIREAEEINEDWWYGVYAGDVGVFPKIFVREA